MVRKTASMNIILKLHYGEAELLREQLRVSKDDAILGMYFPVPIAKCAEVVIKDLWKELELYFVKRTQYRYQGNKVYTFSRAQFNALAILLMVGMPPAEQVYKHELYTRLLKTIDKKLN